MNPYDETLKFWVRKAELREIIQRTATRVRRWQKQSHRFVECLHCGWRGFEYHAQKHHHCALAKEEGGRMKDEQLVPARMRIFNSLNDWLDPEVPTAWLTQMLDEMRVATGVDFLLLTKRPELFEERLEAVLDQVSRTRDEREDEDDFYQWLVRWLNGNEPPMNLWLGTSVENPETTERIGLLGQISAKVRFLIVEPLLESLGSFGLGLVVPQMWAERLNPDGIHWVIVGGESDQVGAKARPFQVEWALELYHEVTRMRDKRSFKNFPEAVPPIAFFMKQLGSNAWFHGERLELSGKGGDRREWPTIARTLPREFPGAFRETTTTTEKDEGGGMKDEVEDSRRDAETQRGVVSAEEVGV